MDIANQQLTSTISVEAQSTQMAELSLKLRRNQFNLFVRPFYTLLGNVPNFQIFQNPDMTYYSPPRMYQKIRTAGVELEGNYQFTKQLSLRAVGVFQESKALDYRVYLAKTNSPADDEKVTFDGKANDNIGTTGLNCNVAQAPVAGLCTKVLFRRKPLRPCETSCVSQCNMADYFWWAIRPISCHPRVPKD